jgi:hypothetical protein
MTDSKEFEPLPAYLARVSSLFVFFMISQQMRKMVSIFGVKYNPRWYPSVKEMHPILA